MAKIGRTLSYINTSAKDGSNNADQKKASQAGASAYAYSGSPGNGSGASGVIDLEVLASSLKKLLRKDFLSRLENDSASGIISFMKGWAMQGVVINQIITSLMEIEQADFNDQSLVTAARIILELKKLDEKYLSKIKNDRTPFKLNVGERLTAEKGFQIGESFIPGILTGSGGYFDEWANGEVESLIIRRFLEVPELRFNRVEIKLGDKWNAPGAGIFERVEPDTDEEGNRLMTGTGLLKLEDGEYGAIAVGDICMGIFHSEVASENSAEDSDDSRGNFQFAGFYTCYFTITEITGKDNKQFRYQLRPVSDRWRLTYHPSEAMTFVCYGSFIREDRQTSVYTTRTYTRLLKNQNTWEISASNIAMQYGNMENMNVHGLDMTGYSMYLNNIYMTGVLKQVKPDGTPINVANERGAWIGGETYAFYDRVSHNGSMWLCVNEIGTNSEPSKGNSDWLLEVAAGDSLIAEGRFSSSKTPYQPNSLVDFADKVWIATEITSNAPYGCWTDNSGNRLLFNDGGFALHDDTKDASWEILLDVSNFNDGKDGAGLIVQYSSDKVNWHDTFVQNSDIYMRQKVGEDGVWSDAIRIVGEDGQAKEGIYTDFQFAVGSSLTTAPSTGWQDAPPSVDTGQYIWMRVRVVDPGKGTTTSWAVTRIGGEKGKDGTGINSVTVTYGVSDNPSVKPGSWGPSIPTANEGQCLWVRTVTDYTDESKEDTVTYTYTFQGKNGIDGTPVKVSSIKYQAGNSSTTVPTGSWSSSVVAVQSGQFLWTKTTFSDDSVAYGVAKQGEDGAGMSLLGNWKTGVVVPYLGVVRMGSASWSAKKETINPPLWCFTDNSGNRLLFNGGGYIITGEVNTSEYQEVATDGTNGADGKDGKDGKDGIQGIQGCIVRDSEWAVNVEYRNDEALTSGTRYIDVVLVRDDSTATGWVAYKCKKTHVSTSSITPTNTTYWEEFSTNVTSIFTSLIIAKNAKITFLQGNRLAIQKQNGDVTAGISGSEEGNKIRFWAGSESPDSAPFRVNEEGEAWLTKAHVSGEVTATSGKIGGFKITGTSLYVGDEVISNPTSNVGMLMSLNASGIKVDMLGMITASTEMGLKRVYIAENEYLTSLIISHYQSLVSSTRMCGLKVDLQDNDIGIYVNGGSTHILSSGITRLNGLVLNKKVISYQGQSISENDDIITFNASSDITVVLPSTIPVGKVLYFKNTSSKKVSLTGDIRLQNESGYGDKTVSIGSLSYMAIKTDLAWTLFNCG